MHTPTNLKKDLIQDCSLTHRLWDDGTKSLTLQAFPLMPALKMCFIRIPYSTVCESIFQVIGTHVDSITLVGIVHDGFHVDKDGISTRLSSCNMLPGTGGAFPALVGWAVSGSE